MNEKEIIKTYHVLKLLKLVSVHLGSKTVEFIKNLFSYYLQVFEDHWLNQMVNVNIVNTDWTIKNILNISAMYTHAVWSHFPASPLTVSMIDLISTEYINRQLHPPELILWTCFSDLVASHFFPQHLKSLSLS